MTTGKAFLGLSVLALAPALSAQTLQPLVSQGDTVIGVGAVQQFNPPFLGLTDSRMWILTADTDYAGTTEDTVMLRNGFVTLREGSNLIYPAGALLNAFVSVDLANNGNLGLILTTRNPTNSNGNLYWNLIKVGDLETPIDAPPLGANTKWLKFEIVKLNNANQLFCHGEINNTAVTGSREDLLIRYDLDSVGNVLAKTVLYTNGMPVPALGTTVEKLAVSPTEHILAINKHGDYLAYVIGFGSVNAVLLNGETICAQELAPSSVGVNWNSNGLGLSKLDLNDFGEWVLTGSINADNSSKYLIEKNGQKFVRSGDVLPEYSSAPISDGKTAPIYIANTGDIFWRAETTAGEAAYLRNYEPIVKSGTTTLGGNLVVDLPTNEHSFAISPNGRFFIGRIGNLQSVGESSVIVDFGLVVKVPGCTGNAGQLYKNSGEARVGTTLQLAMTAGQEPGVLPVVLFSTQAPIPGSDCGIVIPSGELLVSPAHRIASLVLPTWNANPVAVNINIPNNINLVNTKLWAQGFFRDANGSSGEPTRMTNGLLIEVGAP